eukprot:14133-Eustigmatos_ZCMA.PRE.1
MRTVGCQAPWVILDGPSHSHVSVVKAELCIATACRTSCHVTMCMGSRGDHHGGPPAYDAREDSPRCARSSRSGEPRQDVLQSR